MHRSGDRHKNNSHASNKRLYTQPQCGEMTLDATCLNPNHPADRILQNAILIILSFYQQVSYNRGFIVGPSDPTKPYLLA
jgi:hypothetical protein